MRYDTRDTLLAKKIKQDNLNDKLSEIMRRLELFVLNYGYYPKQLLLDYNTFEEIQNQRVDILRIFDEQYFILNMKIVF